MRKKREKRKEKIGVAGLRSPCLPHAKGVLYQVSYNPRNIFYLQQNTSSFLLSFLLSCQGILIRFVRVLSYCNLVANLVYEFLAPFILSRNVK